MLQTLKEKLAHFSHRTLWQRRVFFGLVGAVAGFGYYTFIGCASGTCPISSNPFISTAYGTLIGVFVPAQKKKS